MRMRLLDGPVERTLDLGRRRDLSLPIRFDADLGRAFHISAARSEAVAGGGFVGDVRRGGSCNCETHHLTPHGDGTHTEGVGHILADRVPVVVDDVVCAAIVVRVVPRALGDSIDDVAGNHADSDLVVDAALLADAVAAVAAAGVDVDADALVVATAAGGARREQRHSGTNPPYFTFDAATWVRERGYRHLLLDLPSLDREDDGGLLSAHRAFFDVPPGARSVPAERLPALRTRTITELCAVDDDIAAGRYALFLQVAPIVADAAPSRPLLVPFAPPA